MYTTRALYSREEADLHAFLAMFPFATMRSRSMPLDLSCVGPIISDERRTRMIGHLDLNNPALEYVENEMVLATFIGPNGYISPGDYAGKHFPTWNFSCAHLTGYCRVHHEEVEKHRLMEAMIARLEASVGGEYRMPADDPAVPRMLSRIAFLTIEISTLQGVFKYSQEKPEADCRGARDALLDRSRRFDARAFSALFTPGLQATHGDENL